MPAHELKETAALPLDIRVHIRPAAYLRRVHHNEVVHIVRAAPQEVQRVQVFRQERYHVPNEMTFNDEGIQVEFADKKETYEWEQIQKVVTTPKTIGFYYETEKALIVPKPDFGDKFVPILTLATKKLGPARVHLR